MKDFFISYNKADRAWAEWIAWELEQAGHSTVIQAWDFRPGANFVLEMQQGAADAARTIAVLSPDYLTSRFTQPEWAAAFAKDPTGKKRILLPIRVRECDLEGMLPQIIYIDFVNADETTARQQLIDGIAAGRAKPTTAPKFPQGAPGTPNLPRVAPRFPGALPPIWNVPLHRNPNFTGREQLLTDLRVALESGKTAALTQAISGLGGVGKTQLALEYAYRYSTEYDLVWWMHAEEPATLAAEYAALAVPLDLPEKQEKDQTLIVQAVRAYLDRADKYLLVFDNANEPGELEAYRPQGGSGHVLITSRNQVWRKIASPLPVKEMTRAEAIDFLTKRTCDPERASAEKLAEALGDLPLALEQAGAYVDETGGTLAGYLALFKARESELLKAGKPSREYPATVATTWEISFREVEKNSPAAADLLDLCSFFAPDDIPLDIIASGKEHLTPPLSETVADPLKMDQAIGALRRYSLVSVGASGDSPAISIHRLVQGVARDRLEDEERKHWVEAAVKIVNDAYPSDIAVNPSVWPQCSRLLPHAFSVSEHATELAAAPDSAARLFNQTGLYLQGRAQFGEAKKLIQRALAIDEATYGPHHPKVAIRANNLGGVLQDLGDLPAARQHFERALAIGETVYGPNHPQVAIYANNLGGVLKALGDLPAARHHLERALAILRPFLPEDHPNIKIVKGNLETLQGK